MTDEQFYVLGMWIGLATENGLGAVVFGWCLFHWIQL